MVPFRKSLAFRVFFLSFILLTLPLLVDLIILMNQRFTEALDQAKYYLEEVGKVRELPLTELLPSKSPILLLVENTLDLKNDFPEEASSELNNKLKILTEKGGLNQIDLYKIVNGKYIVIGSSYEKNELGINDTYVGRDDTDFIEALDLGKKVAQANTIYVAGERESYFVNAKIIFSNGSPIGALIIYTDISESLNTFLLPDIERYPLYFGVLTSDTLIYASTDASLVFHYFIELGTLEKKASLTELKVSEEDFPHRPLPIQANDYPFFEFIWKGREFIGYVIDIPSNEFFLLVYADKAQIFSYLIINFIHTYGTYFIILLLGGIAAFYLTRRLARPINTLTSVMDEIQKGNNVIRCPPDRFGYELNLVSETFNEMMDTLVSKKKVAEEERVNWAIYKKELKLGEEVQKRLYLNKKIIFPGIDITTRYVPAKEVGGDFCDIFIDNPNLVLMIADASGKGVEACFYSLLVRGMLRIFSREVKDVAKVIKKTNELFVKDVGDTGIFVTVLLGIYNQERRELSYYSAGHNPPILRRKRGGVEFLESHGVALGVEGFEDEEKQKKTVTLEPGDLILFYTDGITEAHDEKNELFSEKKLLNLVQAEGDKNVEELSDIILNEVKKFAGNAPQHDDITLIAMKVI